MFWLNGIPDWSTEVLLQASEDDPLKAYRASILDILGEFIEESVGTFKTRGKDAVFRTLDAALAAGYRSIDTAAVYRNEEDIGTCLQELLPKHGLTRQDIFITSKLGPKSQGAGECRQACLRSLNNLQTDYLDLFLIHWPGTQGRKPDDPSNQTRRQESWREMERLVSEGRLRDIGVSNYEGRHLKALLQHCVVPPAVLQIEHHPHLIQSSLVKLCSDNSIHFQAYASLGTSTDDKLISDPVVTKIAASHQKSPAQILLRWAVQQNIGVIPKSTNPEHIADNIDIFDFELSESDRRSLSGLDKQHHYCWDPGAVV